MEKLSWCALYELCFTLWFLPTLLKLFKFIFCYFGILMVRKLYLIELYMYVCIFILITEYQTYLYVTIGSYYGIV